MQHDTFTLDRPGGAAITVRRWLPAQDVAGALIVAHGLAEHGGRYAPLAERFVADDRFAVYAVDHRGHGLSVPVGQDPGHMSDGDGFALATADLAALIDEVRGRHPDRPRVLFGHSGGSFMVQRLLVEGARGIDAAILSGSNGKPPPIAAAGRALARVERLRLGKRGQSDVLNAMSFQDFNRHFAPNRTEFDWLSRDEAQVDRYVDDPLCGFEVSVQTWVSLLDFLPGLTEPAALAQIPKDLPIYIFSGSHDPVGEMGKGVQRLVDAYHRAWLTNVTHRLYEGGRHEMLNELNRDEVIGQLQRWTRRVLEAA